MPDKAWQLRVGSRGTTTGSDPISEVARANLVDKQKRDMKRESELADLEHREKKVDIEANIAKKEKELKGENVMAEELKEEREKLRVAEKEVEAGKREAMEARLTAKIEQLSEVAKSKGSGKEFTETFTQLTEAAKAMGWVAPTKEEPKTFAEQLNQAVDIATKLGYDKADKQSQMSLELERLKADNTIRLEEMKDARDVRDKEWQLKLKQWEEEKEHKREEIQAKIDIEKERNQLIANAITELKGFVSEIRGKGGGVAQPPVNYVTAGVGETGELECPGCKAVIPVGGDDTTATCPGCGAAYPIRRIPKPPEPAAASAGEK